MSEQNGQVYEFGGFRFDAGNQVLWNSGEPVSVPPKALLILSLLLEKNGEIVSRQELLERVWHATFVEEANITYTISLLRKALGDKELVQTIPKRGYRFTAEINASNGGPQESKTDKAQAERKPRTERRHAYALAGLVGFCFLAGLMYFAWPQSGAITRPSPGTVKTLAVLPFKSLTPDDDSGLALGLTDSLISRLGSLKRWTIRPLSAVEGFAKSKKDSVEFGGVLKCDAVLVGTVQTSDDRLRVNVRLLSIPDGNQIWTSTFEESESDVFLLQTNLATQVAGSLLERLTENERRMLGSVQTENAEAYRAYLRGKVIFDRRVDGGFQQSLDEFQKAISLDPVFPLPYAGLADLFSRDGNRLSGAESKEAYRKAKSYAEKALELDGDLSEAHASLGRIRRIADWDWKGAEKEFNRAIELDPNNAAALAWNAQMLSSLGRHDEALSQIRRAIEIDPISPSITGILFPVLEGRGEFDEGLKLAEAAYKFDKENMNSRRSYATFLYHKGEYGKVIEVAADSMAKNRNNNHVWLSLLAAAYLKTEQTEKAAELLRQLKTDAETNPKYLYSLALNYAEMNRFDESIAALEKCYEMREERLLWMTNEPRFGELKNDGRFLDIVRKMRLR